MNKVIVHGRLTRDPEMRDAGSSTVCWFTVAENQRFDRDKTNFHDCEAWGKTGEFVEKYFHKGSEIVVSGELRQREYEAKDGTKRRVWAVNVDAVDFCGKAADNGGSRQSAQESTQTGADGFTDVSGEELPF